MTDPLDGLRRQAKDLRKAFEAGDARARERVAAVMPVPEALRHADALHVLAREAGFASWPAMKLATETQGMDRAARQRRLKIALAQGQTFVTERLLEETPDLVRGLFGLECALYDRAAVEAALARDPGLAVRDAGPVRPILHLARSRMIHVWPDRAADMIAVAEALLAAGADVNDAIETAEGPLSALYLALGQADNLVLARWLLERGADPNDGESLYHATELPHVEGLRLLVDFGARPNGTNALLRAIDFDDAQKVRILLEAGADPNEFVSGPEVPWVIPALHQLARRGASEVLCRLLLEAGADVQARYQGVTPYAYARVFGNQALARLLAAAGADTALSADEALLAEAARGRVPEGRYIDPARLAPAYAGLIREIVHLPGRLPQMKVLVAIGMEYDRPDAQGVPPVQAAGWEGLPEVLDWFIGLRPDLTRVNAYGGTLLGTIIHGSENCPVRAERDYVACLRLALEHGLALPRSALQGAGEPDVAAFLADWAAAHPEQVVDG